MPSQFLLDVGFSYSNVFFSVIISLQSISIASSLPAIFIFAKKLHLGSSGFVKFLI